MIPNSIIQLISELLYDEELLISNAFAFLTVSVSATLIGLETFGSCRAWFEAYFSESDRYFDWIC